jgi:hypothetical protein
MIRDSSTQETAVTDRGCWDSFDSDTGRVVERLTDLVSAADARRIRVEHNGQIVAEFPLSAVAGADDSTATRVATVGALVAFLDHCTVRVEH